MINDFSAFLTPHEWHPVLLRAGDGEVGSGVIQGKADASYPQPPPPQITELIGLHLLFTINLIYKVDQGAALKVLVLSSQGPRLLTLPGTITAQQLLSEEDDDDDDIFLALKQLSLNQQR